MTGLAKFIQHAERFTTEEVFETAVEAGLSMDALGKLALRLRNLDPHWRLVPGTERLFIKGLLGEGWTPKQVAAATGASRSHAHQLLGDEGDGPHEELDVALRRAIRSRWEPGKGSTRKVDKWARKFR